VLEVGAASSFAKATEDRGRKGLLARIPAFSPGRR